MIIYVCSIRLIDFKSACKFEVLTLKKCIKYKYISIGIRDYYRRSR